MSLASSTIAALRQRLVAKEITPRDIVLDVAQAIEAKNPALGAYLSWDVEKALKEADQADLSQPLGGIPIGIKDNMNVLGEPCTCGSKMLSNYVAPYDAGAIQKMRAGGAVPLGRLNMDEFAMGSSTENSALGVTRNPVDLDRIPGGSSGGSAAAVAGQIAIATLGSDTGGSIRQPAALCGCVGLKPTYGRISRFGLVAFASSLDQIGPITKTVEDAALLLNHLCGKDLRDSTSLDVEVPDFSAALGQDIKGLRIGLPKEYFISGIHAGVSASVKAAIQKLESLGAIPVEISLPHTDVGVSTYYILAPAEASANLARFDGVRYGHRSTEAKDLMEHYMMTREEGFGAEVKRRILLGTYVLSSGYYDAYYIKAQRARTLIRQDFEKAFQQVDVIVSPTSPTPAHKLGALKDNPLAAYLEDIFTIPVNLAGLPGISVPCGTVQEDGKSLPVGLQIIGKPLDEVTVLRVADAFEKA
ncbi:aspartyl/glutamyl-tRNA(Asn/Gln) amidotransferase subunit A [Prosthecobacter debontii]|uniref:Glutamyl-tRNA(Gln) amidotransferase subunit A n=1 Tax=Prosthecobacter debontii TaxID=48467 RepID=A0A1T4Y512_9BACT|nr:Asp-tRNA(Asn)/Glu-tRNA(Gln) amidotransferase subunit GatA [Prosthecobacter debontii]SKA96859.1 aspartyl/glutamyl-tRNA(Asn/Gln) amidotransferase subunit A [Prosthecobacter debontii]